MFHSRAKTSSHDDNHMLSQNICVWTIHSKMSLDKFRGFCCCLSSVESLADPSEVLSVTLPDGNYHWIELNRQLCAGKIGSDENMLQGGACGCLLVCDNWSLHSKKQLPIPPTAKHTESHGIP